MDVIAESGTRLGLNTRVVRRRWGLMTGSLAVIAGMLYLTYWPAIAGTPSRWPLYIAHWDGWINWHAAGSISQSGGFYRLFVHNPQLLTVPGWPVLIAPIAWLGRDLAYPTAVHAQIAYPAAWWLVGPVYLSPMMLAMCALDHWVDRMATGISPVRRVLVLACAAVGMLVSVAFGHPEDIMALGAGLYALSAAFDRRYRACGWWLAIALCMQIWVVLLVPLMLLRYSWPQRRLVLGRALAFPLAVIAIPVIGGWSHYVGIMVAGTAAGTLVARYRTPAFFLLPSPADFSGRIFEVFVAYLIADRWHHYRWDEQLPLFWWCAGAAMTLRVIMEPISWPYYLMPCVAIWGVGAGLISWRRCMAVVALIAVMTSTQFWYTLPALAGWWILVAGMGSLGWMAWPGLRSFNVPKAPIPPQTTP